jgi:putative oxidoreductase
MKKFVLVVRILLSLLLLVSFVGYVFQLFPEPDFEGNARLFHIGMEATGYVFLVVKCVELVCALSFLTGRYVALAAVVLTPLSINIFLFHLLLVPEGMPVGILMLLATGILLYAHRNRYQLLLTA